MALIGIRSVPWADTLRRDEGGPWVIRKVESRVEFVIDDKTVTDLGRIDAEPEHVTLFDVTDSKHASEILMGRSRLDEDFPPVGRLPLLVCPCGNPGEGSLTVRLMVDEAIVTWDQWAWEHDTFPIEWLPDLPECRFPADEYQAAVRAAGELAAKIEGQVSSVTRVRDHGYGILRWLETRLRGELACQLDWLEVEVVSPAVEARGTEFTRLLSSLSLLREVLVGATERRGYTPTREHIDRATSAATAVLASPESFRLPKETLEAAEWMLERLPRPRQGRARH